MTTGIGNQWDPGDPPEVNLGQQTGSDDRQRADEARRILAMMSSLSIEAISEHVSARAASLVQGMRNTIVQTRSKPDQFMVTGKQLFFLRDIKDKLIDKGIL